MLRNIVFFSDLSVGIFDSGSASQTELLIQTVCLLRNCSVSASYVLESSSFERWFSGSLELCKRLSEED